MRAGQLDRRITIERKVVTQDPNYGTEVINWTPLVVLPGSPTTAAPLWANVEDVLPSRSEAVKLGLAVARNQTRVRIRFRPDVDSSMRIIEHRDAGDRTLEIVGGPATIGRKEWTEFMCEEISL